jgi:hypothetical protein
MKIVWCLSSVPGVDFALRYRAGRGDIEGVPASQRNDRVHAPTALVQVSAPGGIPSCPYLLSFREKRSRAELGYQSYLRADNWELDTETSRFPGAPLGRGQELSEDTHPHLQLDRTMISIPRVRPGDQAWWHCGEFQSAPCDSR